MPYKTIAVAGTALLQLAVVLLSLALAPELAAQGTEPAVAATTSPLRPGDVVRVNIYREPELSGDFVVDERGVVVLPRIGAVPATQEATEALRARLIRGYEEMLTHTSITVTLLRRVQVTGAVRNPGLYPVDATMSISDALALAGGATPQGNPRRVELIRGGHKLPVHLEAGAAIAHSPIQSGDQIYVPERSWLTRNTGVATAIFTGSASLLIAILRR